MRIDGGRGLWGAVLVALLSTATRVHAQGCEPRVARIISVQGPVVVERSGAPRAQAAGLDDIVCPGDRVRVGALGRAAVQLANEAETPIRLDEGTTLIFPAPEPEKSFLLKLIEGVVHVLSRVPQALTIETPMIAAYVEGTEFVLGVSKSEAALWVFEGRVRVSNPQGQLEVRSGEGALARPGQAPERRVLVKPREAVEWALYYPPLVDPRPESYPPALRAALSAYRANDLPAAFAALDRVPARDRDGRYFLLRAGLLLSVGRVAKAEADLAKAERADPKSGGVSALRSIIALVRDQKDDALRLAETGAGLEPNSPLPQAALSYAHQGRFEIEKALEHAKRAVELTPEDALLWARVSELELSRGDLDAALEAAQKAETLSPALARTQTVLGFAYLTRIEVDKAKSAFERAIQGDPADPLPRLGMGLAKIRDGDLDEGTREIETAASLDPNNSLVRSYLGKAYYEQKRDGLASSEYEQAKLLDPKDPTPWFYDAIHKQTTNRPVEALHDLEQAIALNDNRVVYRSKLLLDEDLAARSAALGRIYQDLGFGQRALVEGWKSVNSDPADYSGHRLLADSYSALPRHEVARVSELLQSQLLQPINITPVQPTLAESNLLILDGLGPQSLSFNEFNPLFLRDDLAFQAAAVVGDNSTNGEEIVLSGVLENISYSFGQFHYETEGFRPNNDFSQDLYNAFIQARVSPKLSVQLEARHRERELGDLPFRFDLTDFLPLLRTDLDVETVRGGAHYAASPNVNVIGSMIYVHEFQRDHEPGESLKNTNEGVLGEAQGIAKGRYLSLIGGAGYYDALRTDGCCTDIDQSHANAYLYGYLHYPTDFNWTIGVSFDSQHIDELGATERVNPKFGLVWYLTPSTTLRGAVFSILKRPLLDDQTIEPTQVAGFNQFFDDFNGTDSFRYGIGLDQRLGTSIYAGIEFSERTLDEPINDPETGVDSDLSREEDLYRGYLYWVPHRNVAVRLEHEMELFESDDRFRTRTHYTPVSLRYFHPSGFVGQVGATYVHQSANDQSGNRLGEDEFLLINAEVGFRLPKRYGIIRFGVRNLFDTEFSYRDIDNRTAQIGVPPRFLPERTLYGQATISF